MYELLVLSLLMDWPLHAYLMADIANAILGPWERISRGTLSTLVARLEREGLIAPADPAAVPFPSKRTSRAFAITAAGRRRFERLMLDTASSPGTYLRLFHIKALHLHLLAPADQLALLDHYIGYCQAGLGYMQGEAYDMAANHAKRQHTPEALRRVALGLMHMEAQHWQLEIDWARQLRAQAAPAGVSNGPAEDRADAPGAARRAVDQPPRGDAMSGASTRRPPRGDRGRRHD
jgi:DNA-binding PadR family transcriptional regulator